MAIRMTVLICSVKVAFNHVGGHHCREQRLKFPKKRRILRPGEVISLAGLLPNCCSLGFSIRLNSHVNFICAMQDICDVIR
ncbi:hypothetical protein SFRURICE_009241 [Spodoptera frugiperda]|nr:hypothetical protein SFRURICE_009241 [Spodoptera frugiperda]